MKNAFACGILTIIFSLALITCDDGSTGGGNGGGDDNPADEITISFNADGGTVTPLFITAKAGTTVTLPTPVRDRFFFTGWYNSYGIKLSDGENRYTVVGTDPITMIAKWTVDSSFYTVTFDATGGTVTPDSITEKKGSPIILPIPTRDGYVFEGWYNSFSGGYSLGNGGDSYNPPINVANFIYMYARWSVPYTYTITFISEGGSEVEPIITGQNSVITLPTPVLEGYGFAGWFSSAQGGTQYGVLYGDNYNYTVPPVSGNTSITMYARWVILRTVTFDTTDGKTPTSISAMEGSPIVLPSPTRYGYIFKGWYSEKQGGTKYGVTSFNLFTVTGDITMYAQWWPIYTVKFDKTDGTAPTTQDVSEGFTPPGITINLPTPTRTGYTFNGWYSAAQGGIKYGNAGASYAVTGDITMYAQWTEIPRYTVTFDPNGAASTPAPVTEYVGTSIRLPSLSRTGYFFRGWYNAASGGTLYGIDGVNYTVNGNVTMYAQWTVRQYTITYNANEGTVTPTSQTENYDALIALPVPTRTGYTFNGWYSTDVSGTGTKYGNSEGNYTVSAANVTMYARWTINRYTISFDANGGTIILGWSESVNSTYNSSITLPTPTRDGYTFSGWYSAAQGGTKYGNAGSNYTIPAANIEMYAQWLIHCTITFDSNYGSNVSPITGVPETSTITLPTPTWTGFHFDGWFSAETGGNLYGTGGGRYTVTGNVTMYAQWTIEYTVTFLPSGSNGGPDIAPITVPSGTRITMPSPSEYARVLRGWYTEPERKGDRYAPGSSVVITGNLTLYSWWDYN
ncbi:MAG: InlB B-repeat-containing protein [Treponema sp.]|jgi:uncharacterized repeat protein (TIGR02543 family)|nr:InlB B-repeat-containing protein [Treponema sp.]